MKLKSIYIYLIMLFKFAVVDIRNINGHTVTIYKRYFLINDQFYGVESACNVRAHN